MIRGLRSTGHREPEPLQVGAARHCGMRERMRNLCSAVEPGVYGAPPIVEGGEAHPPPSSGDTFGPPTLPKPCYIRIGIRARPLRKGQPHPVRDGKARVHGRPGRSYDWHVSSMVQYTAVGLHVVAARACLSPAQLTRFFELAGEARAHPHTFYREVEPMQGKNRQYRNSSVSIAGGTDMRAFALQGGGPLGTRTTKNPMLPKTLPLVHESTAGVSWIYMRVILAVRNNCTRDSVGCVVYPSPRYVTYNDSEIDVRTLEGRTESVAQEDQGQPHHLLTQGDFALSHRTSYQRTKRVDGAAGQELYSDRIAFSFDGPVKWTADGNGMLEVPTRRCAGAALALHDVWAAVARTR
ncbi:hypothetical protein C2E23DRAFT_862572 [Lenzites betulinus]|nr:hypothetical protein C2E23DRAFT_862572 [Lenzites betulinus]